ncbi:MAG TPA: Hint domain-containing protein, partial [Candidatus Limnocylindrales bacterium]|nr:Hint domain-containing protein [Candidatus Limnocylindrales bacterium]
MSTARRLLALVGLVVVVAACSGSSSPTPTPGQTATPGPALTLPELKLALVARFGQLWYCDPDFYPIARQDELASARERWAAVVADTEAFAAITSSLGLDPGGPFDDAQTLDVYRAWKVLNAIGLDPIGNDTYRFDYLAEPAGGAAQGTRTGGMIAATGAMTIEQQVAAGEPICPICLARGTLIEAPGGPLPVEGLRIGDPVWTLDAHGARVRGAVVAVGSTSAPAGHHVIRLVLADGRTVTASPGHPLADGRPLG